MLRVVGQRSIVLWLVLMGSLFVHTVASASGLIFNSGKQQVRLVELFTSQGCSSCPPADRWVNQFISNPDLWKSIVPVAFHVDYWDYLGWRDVYAAPDYSDRQRQYRTQGSVRSVYTPGFLIDGREWRGWFSRDVLPRQVLSALELRAMLGPEGLSVNYPSRDGKLVLNVAILGFGIETPIRSGENEGSRLPHDFVVLAHDRHISSEGVWNVSLPLTRVRGARRFALALWVSDANRQVPLQATGGWLPQDMIRRL